MDIDKTESFNTRQRRLRQCFLDQIPERLCQVREALLALAPGVIQEAQLKHLHLLFHTLKGSGASFGFPPINAAAKVAEQLLQDVLKHDARTTNRLINALHEWLEILEKLELHLDPPIPNKATPEFEISDPRSDNHVIEMPRRRLIYLCDDDSLLAREIAGQLACFGYHVTPLTTLAALRQAVQAESPAAVIMDVVFPEGIYAGPTLMTELNSRLQPPVPSIFISSQGDFASRLHAVQAGGSAYCTKPVKTVEMVEFLDLLTDRHPVEPFHILVVDDDPHMAQLHASVLEEAGMVVRVSSEPEAVLDLLSNFAADLVLMDLYMPHCSGQELAQVLRQIPGYISLPIIYVSAETDAVRQLQALQVGADGFLTKPVKPERLVNEVLLRAERMRTLRALMVRDSLTGLFNHNTILQLLDIALSTSRRNANFLCFAMLDVDRFKTVNDTYGHPVGDQVLMALSRTLRLCLRDTDLVGRYGGEEFAVVLSGINVEQAKHKLDTLRESFANVAFFAETEHVFHCTFSAGVAAFPDFPSANMLTEAADRALYQAKHAGRNRVEIARPMVEQQLEIR